MYTNSNVNYIIDISFFNSFLLIFTDFYFYLKWHEMFYDFIISTFAIYLCF